MKESDPQIKKQASENNINEIQCNKDSLPPICELIKSPSEAETCYRFIFENTGTAIVILDQDTSILHFNQKVQKITGYSKEEIIKKKRWTEFVPIEDLERFLKTFKQRYKDPSSVPSEFQFRIKNANGKILEMMANGALIPDSCKTMVSFYDISNFKQVMNALRESERKYRDLYENANDILFTVDLNGHITSANNRALKTYGYSRNDIVKFEFRSIIDPEYLHLVEKHIQEKLLTPSKSSTYEILTYTREKVPVWLELSTRLIFEKNKVVGIQGIGRDITERKRSEEKLWESQKRFKETADLLPGIICEMDTNLYLTYVNEIGLELFGYTQSEFDNGVCARDLIAMEYREKFEKTVATIFNGATSTPSVYVLLKKDNTPIYVLLSSAAIVRNGVFTGIRTCFFDISDRVLAEKKLRLSEERFRTIYSESPIGIALYSPDGFLIDMNQSFCRLFNISADKSQFSNLFQFFNFNQAQRKKLAAFEKIHVETEFYRNGEKTDRLFLDWYITPVGSPDTTLSVYLVQVQDTTERKKAQEARIKEEREATARAEALVAGLKRELCEKATFHNMISRSAQMMKIFNSIPEIAQTSVTVLISGNSGTGKELVARSLHELSNRKDKPFVAINCSALPDTLLESELFGYKAGAFTDAKKDKPGKFALAEGGTIFLDEIGDISAAMQVKLLRVLQERFFEPLGATQPCYADIRIIAATNKSLPDMVASGEFREDLYYRINVITIKLPPLTERRCDIPLLAEYFIQRFNDRYGKSITGIDQQTMEVLLSYDFPGNIRELENIIEHAFIFCKDSTITLKHLPDSIRSKVSAVSDAKALSSIRSFTELERMYLKTILDDSGGCKTKAAEKLGIHKTTLFRKLKQLGIK